MLGTVKTVIDSPCGFKVGSKNVDLCKMARANLPIIDELVCQAADYYKCLPKVLDLVDKDIAIALAKSLDVSAALGDVMAKYGDAQQVGITFFYD